MRCGLVLLAAPVLAWAQSTPPNDTARRITLGAFVDAYYVWDFGRPSTFDRSFAGGSPFTTQPARHNEFNVNLAFVEVRLDGADVRGRVALQSGTAVQSNYSGEPSVGATTSPTRAHSSRSTRPITRAA